MWSGHWNSCSFIPLGFACDLLSELVWLCVSMSTCGPLGFHIFWLRLLLWETNHVRYWSLGWVCDRCWDYGFIPVCWIPHGNWTIWMTLGIYICPQQDILITDEGCVSRFSCGFYDTIHHMPKIISSDIDEKMKRRRAMILVLINFSLLLFLW